MKALLSVPAIYRMFAQLVGGEKARRLYVERYLCPREGIRILDIGCGPASVLEVLPVVDYCGFDLNPEYIDFARKKYGRRGDFRVESVSLALCELYRDFDLVLATGVLHHLDDREAEILFQLAHSSLKPGARLVTLDGCYTSNQSYVARFLLRNDRGKFVRDEAGYLRLARSVFPEAKATLRTDLLRIPYTHIILECHKL